MQYLAIRYTERLAETGAVNSVGSKGDSFDNALAETMIGLYKTELVRTRGPSKTSSTPPSNGSTGSTTNGSSKPTARSHRPSTRRSTTASKKAHTSRPRLKPNSLHKTRSGSSRQRAALTARTASGRTGSAVHTRLDEPVSCFGRSPARGSERRQMRLLLERLQRSHRI